MGENGLDQADMAEALGTVQSMVSKLLNGHAEWTGKYIVAAAKRCGVPPSQLLLGVEPKGTQQVIFPMKINTADFVLLKTLASRITLQGDVSVVIDMALADMLRKHGLKD